MSSVPFRRFDAVADLPRRIRCGAAADRGCPSIVNMPSPASRKRLPASGGCIPGAMIALDQAASTLAASFTVSRTASFSLIVRALLFNESSSKASRLSKSGEPFFSAL